MADQEFPPAINGTELRLDAIVGELRALRDLMTPAAPEREPELKDGQTIELREPVATAKARRPK